jgi:hypothetical protein
MANPRWYIARNNERVGPFSAGELQQLARCGLLQPGEYVWAEGAAKWVEAATMPGLFPPPGQKKYWVALGGQARGPYVPDQIRVALANRQLNLDTMVRAEDATRWQPLAQLTEFHNPPPGAVSPSKAQLFTSTLDLEEATLHLAGKNGDAIAKLICTLIDLKRNYAHNPALVDSLESTIQVLRQKREQEATTAAD